LPDRAAGAGGGRAGGESQAHKILKEFIAATPSLVGASKNATSRCEFALRSADEIDVLFQSREEWVGVEVKASTSDGNLRDYQRGLYQVVKYRALLEAQARIDHPDHTPQVRVLLALELALPAQLRQVAKALDVVLLERVGEMAEFAIAKNMRRTARG
jgi:hypothetical protein